MGNMERSKFPGLEYLLDGYPGKLHKTKRVRL